jgi:phosphotransferase system IIB component
MSQLSVLKQQIASIGNDAKTTAQGLQGFKGKFSQAVSQVQATIGGSAQQVDQQMISTLQAAEKQVDAAIAALQQAAQAANKYSSSL